MRERDRVGNGQAQAKARGLVHVAGVVAAHERLQHDILARIGNAGTVVLDFDCDMIR